jgi:hypothetical protein
MSRRSWLLVDVVVVALACQGCASPPWSAPIKLGPTDTGPGTLTAARAYLEGRWTNVSYELFPPGAAAVSLGGTGLLTYDTHGNLTIEVRVDDATARILESAGVPTTNGVLLTSGRAVIDMGARTLTYVLDGQRPFDVPSGPVALGRPRHWRVDGNMLTLTTLDDDGRPTSVGRWQKLE